MNPSSLPSSSSSSTTTSPQFIGTGSGTMVPSAKLSADNDLSEPDIKKNSNLIKLNISAMPFEPVKFTAQGSSTATSSASEPLKPDHVGVGTAHGNHRDLDSSEKQINPSNGDDYSQKRGKTSVRNDAQAGGEHESGRSRNDRRREPRSSIVNKDSGATGAVTLQSDQLPSRQRGVRGRNQSTGGADDLPMDSKPRSGKDPRRGNGSAQDENQTADVESTSDISVLGRSVGESLKGSSRRRDAGSRDASRRLDDSSSRPSASAAADKKNPKIRNNREDGQRLDPRRRVGDPACGSVKKRTDGPDVSPLLTHELSGGPADQQSRKPERRKDRPPAKGEKPEDSKFLPDAQATPSAVAVQPKTETLPNSHEREIIRAEEKKKNDLEEALKREFDNAWRRLKLREANLASISNINGPQEEEELRKRDASLKKCSGFVKKLRAGVTEENCESLIAEAQTLNLSKYISELVNAISESKIRTADVDSYAKVCSTLHIQYHDFATSLTPVLVRVVQDADKSDAANRRGTLRLLAELCCLGTFSNGMLVIGLVKEILRESCNTMEEKLNNLSVISSFSRAMAREFLGLIPELHRMRSSQKSASTQTNSPTIARQRSEVGSTTPLTLDVFKAKSEHDSKLSAETLALASSKGEDFEKAFSWQDSIVPEHVKSQLKNMLLQYFNANVIVWLRETYDDYIKAENETITAQQSKGVIPPEMSTSLDAARRRFERVSTSTSNLAEGLGVEMPELDDGKRMTRVNPIDKSGGGAAAEAASRSAADGTSTPIFDGDEKVFYENLPAISALISLPSNSAACEDDVDDKHDDKNDHGTEAPPPTTTGTPSVTRSRDAPDIARAKSLSEKPAFEQLLARLPLCENIHDIDNASAAFALIGNRNYSRRLSKALFNVPYTKLALIPLYARLVASLHPFFPDIGNQLLSSLEEEFRALACRKDQDEKLLATRIRNARFLGEFVKFRLFPTSIYFELLSICMQDFTHHNIDVACHLMEVCGRMLFRSPETSIRMGVVLDTLWRLKSVRNLEARHNSLVETAYFACRPSQGMILRQRKKRDPLKEYVRKLLYSEITSKNYKRILRQLKKLPWNDPAYSIEDYLVRKILKVERLRFSSLDKMALVLRSLSRMDESFKVCLIDGLLEAIRFGLEHPHPGMRQRRLAEVCLLGELFNQGIIDSIMVFEVLYLFISTGRNLDAKIPVNNVAQSQTLTSLSMELASGQALASVPSSQIPSDLARVSNGGKEPATLESPTAEQQQQIALIFESRLDAPTDFFRLRLCCVLLDTCGLNLNKGTYQKYFEVFIAYFEQYMFLKSFQGGFGNLLPLQILNLTQDTMDLVRDKKSRPKTLAEATEMVRKIEMLVQRRLAFFAPYDLEKWKSKPVAAMVKNVEAPSFIGCFTEKSASADTGSADNDVAAATQNAADASQGAAVDHTNDSLRLLVGEHDDTLHDLESGIRHLDLDHIGDDDESEDDGDEHNEHEDQDESGTDEEKDDGEDEDADADNEENMAASRMGSESVADENASSAEEDEDEEHGSVSDSSDEDSDDDDEADEEEESHADGDEADEEEEEEIDDEHIDDEDPEAEKAAERRREAEEAFARELAAFQAEGLSVARQSAPRLVSERLALPMGWFGGSKSASSISAVKNELSGNASDGEKQSDSVQFKVLIRRGAKSAVREIAVPKSSSLAAAAKAAGEQQRAEQQEMKRLVLISASKNEEDASNGRIDREPTVVPDPIASTLDQGGRSTNVNPNSNQSEEALAFARENRKRQEEAALFSQMFKPRS